MFSKYILNNVGDIKNRDFNRAAKQNKSVFSILVMDFKKSMNLQRPVYQKKYISNVNKICIWGGNLLPT